MARPPLDIASEIVEPRRPPRWAHKMFLATLGIGLATIAWEGGQLMCKRWCDAFDRNFTPHTPVFDLFAATYDQMMVSMHQDVEPTFHALAFHPQVVFPFLLLAMAVAAWLLRK